MRLPSWTLERVGHVGTVRQTDGAPAEEAIIIAQSLLAILKFVVLLGAVASGERLSGFNGS